MYLRQLIWSVIMIIVFIVAEVLYFQPKTIYGDSVSFLTSQGDSITIQGSETVSVTAENDGYFRIYSGDSRLLALPDAKDRFSAQDPAFPAQGWQIKDGLGIKVTLSSDHLLVVIKNRSTDSKMTFLIFSFMLAFLIWALGNSLMM